eukprot:Platyproteum_vivax@DN14432_c0_g1_i1.p1
MTVDNVRVWLALAFLMALSLINWMLQLSHQNKKKHCVVDDDSTSAIDQLRKIWGKNPAILKDRAINEKCYQIRLDCIRLLIDIAEEPSVFGILKNIAASDDDNHIRLTIVQGLEEKFGNSPLVFSLLKSRAIFDQDDAVRRTSLTGLAYRWASEPSTKQVIRDRALYEDNLFIRYDAERWFHQLNMGNFFLY